MAQAAGLALGWQEIKERLLALLGRAGGTDIVGDFFERSWAGDSRTAISYRWTPPG